MRPVRRVVVLAVSTLTSAAALVAVVPRGASAACTPFRAISAGVYDALGVRPDGSLWTWGSVVSEPGQARPEPLTGVRSVAYGAWHALALDGSGLVWAWGDDGWGQLGDGLVSLNREFPTPVRGLPAVKAVGAGQLTSFAIGAVDGSVWGWGRNTEGQLGDGTTNGTGTPVRTGTLTGVVAVAAADFHGMALKSDGTVWTWGFNDHGQLGDGTHTQRLSPIQVPTLSGIVAIAAGDDYSLAVKSDGTVWAWGANSSYELGDGTFFDRASPVKITGVTGAVAVEAGSYHSMALTASGAVYTWGNNGNGEVGDGTTADRHTPFLVPGLPTIVAISGAAQHSFALSSDGLVYGWGWNFYGQLADGSTTDRHSPVQSQLTAACVTPLAPSPTPPSPPPTPTVSPTDAPTPTVSPSVGADAPIAECRFSRGATQMELVGFAMSTRNPAPTTTQIRCTLTTPLQSYTTTETLPGPYSATAIEGPFTPAPVTVCTYAEAVYPDGRVGTAEHCDVP